MVVGSQGGKDGLLHFSLEAIVACDRTKGCNIYLLVGALLQNSSSKEDNVSEVHSVQVKSNWSYKQNRKMISQIPSL